MAFKVNFKKSSTSTKNQHLYSPGTIVNITQPQTRLNMKHDIFIRLTVNCGCSISKMVGYKLDRSSGILSLSQCPDSSRATEPPVWWILGALSPGISISSMTRLKLHGALPPLPCITSQHVLRSSVTDLITWHGVSPSDPGLWACQSHLISRLIHLTSSQHKQAYEEHYRL
jgi:hypothetical protein